MVGVRRAGLPLKLDAITKGDNNCFFNAVFAQTRRCDVAQELAAGGVAAITSPHDLRIKVARFAKRSRLAVVDEFKRRYYATYPEELWDEMWSRMEVNEEWADAITVQATAWFLHHDIHIVMASSTEEMPLTTFSGSWDQEGAPCDKTPLLLGYLNNTHYQSLLSEDEAALTTEHIQPMMFSEIIKMMSGASRKAQQSEGDGSKKDKTSTQKGKTGDKENLEGNYQFLLGSEIASLKPTKEKRWLCPFCHGEQKQIMRHIKSKHLTPSQMEGFAATEEDFKKHLNKRRVNSCRKLQKEIDEEGFNKRNAKNMQASRARQKEVDEKSFNKRTTKASQDYQKRQLENDEEGYRKYKKVANQRHYRKIGSSLDATIKKFHQEILYGPAFECVCCRTMNFRHNVVEYSKTTRTNIRRKADEAHAKEYNSRIQQVLYLFVLTFQKLLLCF